MPLTNQLEDPGLFNNYAVLEQRSSTFDTNKPYTDTL